MLPLENILILDIETVSQEHNYEDLNPIWQDLWTLKAANIPKTEEETPAILYKKKAAIYSEFGKVICISAGIFYYEQNDLRFKVKSFYGNDEKIILFEFAELLNNKFNSDKKYLCAHNGKEFDYPYLSRRMVVHGIKLPYLLDNGAKKPWEITHLDTLEMWKFGDRKNYTSLNLLAALFNIETPKDDINGSKVGEVYWEEKNLERIKTYCTKDVITTAQVLLKFNTMSLLKNENIVVI